MISSCVALGLSETSFSFMDEEEEEEDGNDVRGGLFCNVVQLSISNLVRRGTQSLSSS